MLRYYNNCKIIEIITLMIIWNLVYINIIYSNAFYVNAVNSQVNSNLQSTNDYSTIRNNHNINRNLIKSKVIKKLPKISNIIDRISYQWVNPLMIKGNSNKTLELEDLWLLEDHKQMNNSSLQFQLAFNNERKLMKDNNSNKKPSKYSNLLLEFWKSPLTKAIVKMYYKEFIQSGILKLFNTLIQFIPSLVIARLLKFIQLNKFNIKDSLSSFNLSFSSLSIFNSENISNLINIFQTIILKNHGFQLSILLFLILCSKTTIENQYFDKVTQLSGMLLHMYIVSIYDYIYSIYKISII